MSSPCFGRIIWATIPDQRGLARERHPAVIVSPTEENTMTGLVRVVGVSTKSHLAHASVLTELQYDQRGVCRSKLRERCWAVSTWLAEIEVVDIDSYAGTIPGLMMAEILSKMPGTPGQAAIALSPSE